MRIIPVMDLYKGEVVRGTGGCRLQHRSITGWDSNQITTSSEPVAVAEAFRKHFSLSEIYVADLQAIENEEPSYSTYEKLLANGFRLWVDAGATESSRVQRLLELGVTAVVIGFANLEKPDVLKELSQEFGARLILSLAPKKGYSFGQDPLDIPSNLTLDENYTIAGKAVEAGLHQLIIPAINQRNDEVPAYHSLDLCQKLLDSFPAVELISAENVYGVPDLSRSRQMGIRAVLLSSALHDGRLKKQDLLG